MCVIAARCRSPMIPARAAPVGAPAGEPDEATAPSSPAEATYPELAAMWDRGHFESRAAQQANHNAYDRACRRVAPQRILEGAQLWVDAYVEAYRVKRFL